MKLGEDEVTRVRDPDWDSIPCLVVALLDHTPTVGLALEFDVDYPARVIGGHKPAAAVSVGLLEAEFHDTGSACTVAR